jgi:membrane-associated phospholipid phosphatase
LAATATLTALARLYVGAHLPLDILAGTALGLTTATAARALSVQ